MEDIDRVMEWIQRLFEEPEEDTPTSVCTRPSIPSATGLRPHRRPQEGERIIIVATNWAAEVLARLPGNRFEVEAEMRLNTLEPEEERQVDHLSELRPEYPRD